MSNQRLLLADDSVTIQKVVNLTFADEGIEVVAVGDGNSAMDKFREDVPDIILADVNMPGLNGYELCEKVRQSDLGAKTPVILLVGSFEPFDEHEAKRVGANDFLTKPFQSISQLVSTVMAHMEKGSQQAVVEEAPIVQATQDTAEVSQQNIPAVMTEPLSGVEPEPVQSENAGYEIERTVSQPPAPAQSFETQKLDSSAEGAGTFAPASTESDFDGFATHRMDKTEPVPDFPPTQTADFAAVEPEDSDSSFQGYRGGNDDEMIETDQRNFEQIEPVLPEKDFAFSNSVETPYDETPSLQSDFEVSEDDEEIESAINDTEFTTSDSAALAPETHAEIENTAEFPHYTPPQVPEQSTEETGFETVASQVYEENTSPKNAEPTLDEADLLEVPFSSRGNARIEEAATENDESPVTGNAVTNYEAVSDAPTSETGFDFAAPANSEKETREDVAPVSVNSFEESDGVVFYGNNSIDLNEPTSSVQNEASADAFSNISRENFEPEPPALNEIREAAEIESSDAVEYSNQYTAIEENYSFTESNNAEIFASETAEKTEKSSQTNTGDVTLSADSIEEIVNKVVERLSNTAIRDVAWEVVPRIAERVVREVANEKLKE
ncbi:MAG: response regulator [Pyrinomonadaceae bacterium]